MRQMNSELKVSRKPNFIVHLSTQAPSLRMSEEARQLIEKIPFPASLTDGKDRFVAVNSPHEELYGWSNAELIGQLTTSLISKSVKKSLLDEIQAQSSDDGWHGRLSNTNRKGKRFDIILNTRPVWLNKRKLKLHVVCKPGHESALIRSLLDLVWTCHRQRGLPMVLPSLDQLTPRELEVFERLGRGLRTAEIANELSVSFNTARVYAAAIRRKLHCPNIETLRAVAAQHSWGFDPAS